MAKTLDTSAKKSSVVRPRPASLAETEKMPAKNGAEVDQLIAQAKLEWESTADSLPQMVFLLDEKANVIRANRTVERWGVGRVADIKGRCLHELMHPGCHQESC